MQQVMYEVVQRFTYVRSFPDFPSLPFPPKVILKRLQELFFADFPLDLIIVVRIIGSKIGRFNEPGVAKGLLVPITACPATAFRESGFKVLK